MHHIDTGERFYTICEIFGPGGQEIGGPNIA